jgi:non-heme chloroperoxidase
MRFDTAQLATGPRIHYAEQGDGDGDPILLLHGWPDSWFSYSRVLPLLPQRVRAFALDQRGFGDSERPPTGYQIEQFAADAVAFLDAVSLDRVTIVGHSFGSFVARSIAVAHRDRVSRLVLISTGTSAATPMLRQVRMALEDLQDPVPLDFARDFQASTAYLPLPEAFFDQLVAESLKLPAPLWRAALDGVIAYDDREQLGRIATPTLLIWGDRDSLFPRDDQDALVSAIAGARLITYQDTGHCPNWERPERVAADLQAFLR